MSLLWGISLTANAVADTDRVFTGAQPWSARVGSLISSRKSADEHMAGNANMTQLTAGEVHKEWSKMSSRAGQPLLTGWRRCAAAAGVESAA